jgi:hypothetical protein
MVDDAGAHAATRKLAAAGHSIGECRAAALADVRALASEAACGELHAAVGLDARSTALLAGDRGPDGPGALPVGDQCRQKRIRAMRLGRSGRTRRSRNSSSVMPAGTSQSTYVKHVLVISMPIIGQNGQWHVKPR